MCDKSPLMMYNLTYFCLKISPQDIKFGEWPHVCSILRRETISEISVSTNLSVGPLIENVSRAMLIFTSVEPH